MSTSPGLYCRNTFTMCLLILGTIFSETENAENTAAVCGLITSWYTLVTMTEITWLNGDMKRDKYMRSHCYDEYYFQHHSLHILHFQGFQSVATKCCNKVIYCSESHITSKVLFLRGFLDFMTLNWNNDIWTCTVEHIFNVWLTRLRLWQWFDVHTFFIQDF